MSGSFKVSDKPYTLLCAVNLIIMKTTEELKAKLVGKTYDECQKLLYMWIKQGVVSLRQFKELLHYCA